MLRVNPEVYEALEQWAADEFRSVNGQIEWMLDAKLREHKRLKTKSGQTPADNKSNPQ